MRWIEWVLYRIRATYNISSWYPKWVRATYNISSWYPKWVRATYNCKLIIGTLLFKNHWQRVLTNCGFVHVLTYWYLCLATLHLRRCCCWLECTTYWTFPIIVSCFNVSKDEGCYYLKRKYNIKHIPNYIHYFCYFQPILNRCLSFWNV